VKFELLKEHIFPSYGHTPPFLTEALEAESYEIYYGHLGRRRSRLLFEGGEEGRPNEGWVWSREDTDVEDREKYFEEGDELIRRWGYMIWDKERLDGCGVLGDRSVETREEAGFVGRL